MQCTENSKIWLSKSYFCHSETNIYLRSWRFLKVSCRSCDYRVILRSRSTFQNLESTMWLAKCGKGMLSSVEQAFVGREEIRAPLKTPAWEATGELEMEFKYCQRRCCKLSFLFPPCYQSAPELACRLIVLNREHIWSFCCQFQFYVNSCLWGFNFWWASFYSLNHKFLIIFC